MNNRNQYMILYFGKFNPINENHIKIIDYINNQYNPDILLLIPHYYNLKQYGLKSVISSVDSRMFLINQRLSMIKGNKMNNIKVLKSTIITGLFNIDRISNSLFNLFQSKVTHVIFGSNISQIVNQINKREFKFKFIIINKYNQLKLENHFDQIDICNINLTKITSSDVRSKISNNDIIPKNICHPLIVENAQTCDIYQSFKNIDKIIAIVGSPGSGKSTVGKIIANHLKCDCISTGDIYRNTELNNYQLFTKLELLKRDMKNGLLACAISLLIIGELYKILRSVNGFIIIEGLKCGNILDICKHIKPIDYIINICADRNVSISRIKNRKFRIDDANFESRIDQYYERYHDRIQDEISKCKLKFNKIMHYSINNTSLSIDDTVKNILSFVESSSTNSS